MDLAEAREADLTSRRLAVGRTGAAPPRFTRLPMASALALVVLAAACSGQAAETRGTPTPAVTIAPSQRAPASAPASRPAATASPISPSPRAPAAPPPVTLREYPLPRGQGPHDVAPARDGGVWYTAQTSGELGWLDPVTGATRMVKLGSGSAPHGVIVGPDGAPWITDSGLDAIVRVDPASSEVRRYPLPAGRPRANLNTAVFDASGVLWFTGQAGVYGSLDPRTGAMKVYDAPRGTGPYGIAAAGGSVWYASLAGSYLGRVDRESGAASVLVPPTQAQGARRVWPDSGGRLWVAEWNAGEVGRYDPGRQDWKEWTLPGARPMAYAVYVDELDLVWLTDWGASALVRFDPLSERFDSFPLPANANVRQLLGRHGEVWGALSGLDRLVVARY